MQLSNLAETGLCDYCRDNTYYSSSKKCIICGISACQTSLVLSKEGQSESWVHRQCREYTCLLDIEDKREAESFSTCELCEQSEGNFIRCIIPACNRYSHLFCSKLRLRIIQPYTSPVSQEY